MASQCILIIEEDGGGADVLSTEFGREGHKTIIARNSEEGLRLAEAVLPDRIILGMPIADCLDLCGRLEDLEKTREIPIFMLGQDRAAVAAPRAAIAFQDVSTTSARLAPSLIPLRDRSRPSAHETQVLEVCGVRIDFFQHRAFSNGAKLDLTPTEFRLLECFLRGPGRAFTRSQLVGRAISKGDLVLERTIDSHVKSLRRKLNSNRVAIETVRGIGYRFRDSVD